MNLICTTLRIVKEDKINRTSLINSRTNKRRLKKKKSLMMKEMTMTCLLESTIKCDRLKMDSPRTNGSHQTMKLLEACNQKMMTQMRKKVSRMRTKTTTKRVSNRMTMMMAVTTISDVTLHLCFGMEYSKISIELFGAITLISYLK